MLHTSYKAYELNIQCNHDLVTLNLVKTCDIVTVLQRPFFNLLHKILRFSAARVYWLFLTYTVKHLSFVMDIFAVYDVFSIRVTSYINGKKKDSCLHGFIYKDFCFTPLYQRSQYMINNANKQ